MTLSQELARLYLQMPLSEPDLVTQPCDNTVNLETVAVNYPMLACLTESQKLVTNFALSSLTSDIVQALCTRA
jgi:hypothetical protein